MRAASPAHACQRVVLLKSTQIGGSESLVLNVIAHTIDVAPRSMLVRLSDAGAGGSVRQRTDRADDRDDPALAAARRRDERGRHARTAARSLDDAGKALRRRLAQSGRGEFDLGLSSRPVPIAIMDEVDSCVQNAGRSGNPVRLLTART